jgi:hypothetical protein
MDESWVLKQALEIEAAYKRADAFDRLRQEARNEEDQEWWTPREEAAMRP